MPPSGVSASNLGRQRRGPAAGHAVRPQPGGAREHHHAERVLRLQLRRQHPQRLADDRHAVRAFHRAGFVKQQNQVERTARLASFRGGLDREPEQVAVVGEGIAGAFPGKTDGRAGGGFGIAIIEGVDEFLAPHGGGVRHHAILQARRRQLEGDIADVEREGGEGVVARLDFGCGTGAGRAGWGRGA